MELLATEAQRHKDGDTTVLVSETEKKLSLWRIPMQITLTARDIKLNEATKNTVHAHLEKIERRFPALSRADIVLTQIPQNQFHVNLKVDGAKQHYHTAATAHDLIRAVDIAARHIRAQADKTHKKVTERFKRRLPQKEVASCVEASDRA